MIYSVTRAYADPEMTRLAQWVAAMMPACEAQAAELMVSTEAIVGQAADESAWGRAAIGHNIFGIKADARWTGPKLLQRTAEQNPDGSVYFVDAWFRDYPSFKACIDDHFGFLKANANYAAAGVFTAHSDRGYFEALQRAGYATAVNYADVLMAVTNSVKTFTAAMTVSTTAPAIGAAPTSPPRLLLIGSTGPDVEALKTALTTAHLYSGSIDQTFDKATRAAVIAFQQLKHLGVDGIVGSQTRGALFGA
jgi:flagellar protein FlgJ